MDHLTIFPLQYGEEQQGEVDDEGGAVVALVRVAAEDVLLPSLLLTLLLTGTLPGHLTGIGLYFLLKVKVDLKYFFTCSDRTTGRNSR